jgi:hypothetical protein
MLLKLLTPDFLTYKFLAGTFGMLAGLLLLLITLVLYNTYRGNFQPQLETGKNNYLVINKKVSFVDALKDDEAKNTFSAKEIEEIRGHDFVLSADGFISSQFRITAALDLQDVPGFYTDLFFEAVPQKYVKQFEDFTWSSESKTVPLLVPKDYIRLYNFGFAKSQQLPQISDLLLKNIRFDLRFANSNERHKGRIEGFNDNINSILVPADFLLWANESFGHKQQGFNRVILEVKNVHADEIYPFLEDNNYESAGSTHISSKLNVLINVSLSSMGFVALVLITLSVFLFIFLFQLSLEKSRQNLNRLFTLGYAQEQIVVFYNVFFAVVLIVVNSATLFILPVIHRPVKAWLEEMELDVTLTLQTQTVLILIVLNLVVFAATVIINIYNIRRLQYQTYAGWKQK